MSALHGASIHFARGILVVLWWLFEKVCTMESSFVMRVFQVLLNDGLMLLEFFRTERTNQSDIINPRGCFWELTRIGSHLILEIASCMRICEGYVHAIWFVFHVLQLLLIRFTQRDFVLLANHDEASTKGGSKYILPPNWCVQYCMWSIW